MNLIFYLVFYTVGAAFTWILFNVNYTARVERPKEFAETNEFWKRVEKRVGTKVAVFLILPLWIVPMTMLLVLASLDPSASILLGLFVGIVMMNAIADLITLSRVGPCQRCDFYKERMAYTERCRVCRSQRKETWNPLLPLKYIISKFRREKK